jgi:tRNA pseudouridine55 synthase
MSRKLRSWERPGPAGFLVVDKPPGCTSHDVVDAARRWLHTRQIGHLGTLDPMATGVLPLAVRGATKLIPFIEASDKAYAATIRFGEETDTLDATGTVTARHGGALPSEAALREALAGCVGEIEQIPPMYSAVKRDGVPLHRLARAGREVDRPPKTVRIDRIDLLSYQPPDAEIAVACSAGTYVRVLASDLGRQLGCGAHLQRLRRTRSGSFELAHARPFKECGEAAEAGKIEGWILAPAEVLGLPVVDLTPEEVRQIQHGGEITSPGSPRRPGSRVVAVEPGGQLLAVLEVRPGRRLHPLRVLPVLAPEG